ncbi:ADL101Cp [Eremothecium gossypii ATCC 10895]|uniref:F-actin-capping protein subunit beta n=1 Tax=Eremothecium gossypii (strain ATCC 10895 / CBS 109.51 / FGSC 9923 / NRRL Y-1056) TaxID=284811 RepID=Q75AM4_EREGS|nr:ADL101Cp [Eremothecium gossypii ATCC 10895]AAS51819.1 ADL101Cp [Eremothecium gossypii ATCC 10895]AEY96116.1 FADL101Cp [Eremothecium gossypii FDAG1]
MSEEKYDAAMDLLRRLDLENLESNLQALIELEPALAADLLSSVDTPLTVKADPSCSGREFLCCDYNRDIDSHRSPWSNEYFPRLSAEELAESPFPSDALRRLEVLANDSMDIYRDLYYEGGVSSVYMWSVDDAADDFAGVVLFKKGAQSTSHWDSIHVFEVLHEGSHEVVYRITTTIILRLKDANAVALSGNLTRQTEKTASLPSGSEERTHITHVTNLGSAIEEVEGQMRNLLEVVYFDKTKDVYHELRNDAAESLQVNRDKHQDLIKGLQGL